MNIRRTAIALLAVSALAVAACGADETPNEPAETAIDVTTSPSAAAPAATDTPAASPSAEAPASTDNNAAGGTEINIDEHNGWIFAAIETAEQSAGGIAVRVDDENFNQEWEVDVLVGDKVVEVTTSRDGAEVLGTQDDDDVDEEERAAEAGELKQALDAALGHTPGAIDDAELDEEDGTLYWKVELDRTADGDDVELRVARGTFEVTPDN